MPVGWEPHSYGYHGDDGHIFNGRGTGRPFGPTFGTGDWLGVVLNRVEQTISFTKQGFNLGMAFEGVAEGKLYPSVGFRTPEEEVRVDCGRIGGGGGRVSDSMVVQMARSRIHHAFPCTPRLGSCVLPLSFKHQQRKHRRTGADVPEYSEIYTSAMCCVSACRWWQTLGRT
jgi:hypothetical protein